MIKVFFDNAATTPMAPEVIDVMTDIMKNHYGNHHHNILLGVQLEVL